MQPSLAQTSSVDIAAEIAYEQSALQAFHEAQAEMIAERNAIVEGLEVSIAEEEASTRHAMIAQREVVSELAAREERYEHNRRDSEAAVAAAWSAKSLANFAS